MSMTDSRSKARTWSFCLTLVALNVAVWCWALEALRGRPELLGTALLAYVFGLRHAFDPDHIAAIDNVVRKLMQEGKPSSLVGFYFALGHSSMVVAATLALSGTTLLLPSGILDDFSIIKTSGSAIFLLFIAAANLCILKSIWSAFSRVKRGEEISEEDLEPLLSSRGLLGRVFRPLFRIVTRAWHMFPVGFMFGLGFDTATEIGLFGISANQAAQGTSIWLILLFPALFAAGMTLMDTTDSMLMTHAYGWAFVKPIRKLWYNLTLTSVSVVVAILIGGLEVLGLASEKLDLDSGAWSLIRRVNAHMDNFGYVIVAIFVISWVCSAAIYRLRRYDELHLDRAPS